jgi:hypothetical protein
VRHSLGELGATGERVASRRWLSARSKHHGGSHGPHYFQTKLIPKAQTHIAAAARMRDAGPRTPGGVSPDHTLQALKTMSPGYSCSPASWSRSPGARLGVGLQLSAKLEVKSLLAGGPGAASGVIQPGDVLLAIDGESVVGMKLEAVGPLLQGIPGSQTEITLRCKQTRREKRVTLVRLQAQAGVGMVLRRNGANQLCVQSVEPGGAADAGGVVVGDVVEYIDGQNVLGKKLREVVPVILGEEGTLLTLVVRRNTDGDPITLYMRRTIRDVNHFASPGLDQDEDSTCSDSACSHETPQRKTPSSSPPCMRYDSSTGGREPMLTDEKTTVMNKARDMELEKLKAFAQAELREQDSCIHLLQHVIETLNIRQTTQRTAPRILLPEVELDALLSAREQV